jgi:hypothetical protein
MEIGPTGKSRSMPPAQRQWWVRGYGRMTAGEFALMSVAFLVPPAVCAAADGSIWVGLVCLVPGFVLPVALGQRAGRRRFPRERSLSMRLVDGILGGSGGVFGVLIAHSVPRYGALTIAGFALLIGVVSQIAWRVHDRDEPGVAS